MKILETKNSKLKGTTLHGVPYKEKTFSLYGILVQGVFPVFQGIKVVLDGTVDSLYRELGNTDARFYNGTMKLATQKLKRRLAAQPSLRRNYTPNQLRDIDAEKEKIVGLIWHHYEELEGESPIMQLVDETLHSACIHTGGSYTWNKKHLV
jgi:hypothetical protein